MSNQLRKDKAISNQLKGLAIIAVVGLHLFTFFPPINYFNSNRLIFLSIDQIFRFCVPVFIFLSGYGLSIKYLNQDLNPINFYKSRLKKLLPLYLLWSTYYLFLSELIEPWWKVLETGPIWKILILGWSDYHLYFVSVIFQLYLLYPLLLKLAKKFLNPLLIVSLLTQLGFYFYYSFTKNPPPDQFQNTAFTTWIFYFIFGIYLAKKKSFITHKTSLIIAITGLVFSIIDTHRYLSFTNDIILAIRFTKIPQLLYSVGFISFFLTSPIKSNNNKLLSWLGKNSYLIYLSHPVLIHVANFDQSQVPLIGVLTSFTALIILSIAINKNTLKRVLLLARKP